MSSRSCCTSGWELVSLSAGVQSVSVADVPALLDAVMFSDWPPLEPGLGVIGTLLDLGQVCDLQARIRPAPIRSACAFNAVNGRRSPPPAAKRAQPKITGFRVAVIMKAGTGHGLAGDGYLLSCSAWRNTWMYIQTTRSHACW